MSHELRTPMHAVLSYAELGRTRVHDGQLDATKLGDYFDRIHQSSERLLFLLNDLLDLAKLEAHRMHFEMKPVRLERIAREVANEYEAMAGAKRIRVEVAAPDGLPDVSADAQRIAQVLRNLVSNAVKFSPEDSVIEIGIEASGPILRLTISDRGPGIPEDELEAVFEKFIQSSKTKTGAGGTGLGLAICRQIVAAHGARLWAENRPGGGTRFCLEMEPGDPLRDATAAPPREQRAT